MLDTSLRACLAYDFFRFLRRPLIGALGGHGAVDLPLPFDHPEPGEKRIKYVIGGEVSVYVVAERVQYYGPEGKLITESLKDYTRKAVRKEFASLDDFLRRWTDTEKKQALIEELEAQGILLDALAEEVGKKQGKTFDPFDLICHVAFDRQALTRKERAERVKMLLRVEN